MSTKDVEAAVCQFVGAAAGAGPRVVSLEPNALDDIWRDIARVAEALGIVERGRALIGELQARMEAVAARARRRRRRPTVACIEWVEPLMAAGNWMPTLVELRGRDEPVRRGRQALAVDALRRAGRARSRGHRHPAVRLRHRARGAGSAVPREASRAGARYARCATGASSSPTATAYFNRPGPRVVESLEILAELVHPELFPAKHADAYIAAGTQP